MTRYLKQDGTDHVYVRTPQLAKRPDMKPCSLDPGSVTGPVNPYPSELPVEDDDAMGDAMPASEVGDEGEASTQSDKRASRQSGKKGS